MKQDSLTGVIFFFLFCLFCIYAAYRATQGNDPKQQLHLWDIFSRRLSDNGEKQPLAMWMAIAFGVIGFLALIRQIYLLLN